MGKKVKKKARSGHKEKHGIPASAESASDQHANTAEKSNCAVPAVADRGLCSHIEKGINLDKLSAKLGSSEPIKCEDCRGNVTDRRANKVKGKHGKKGGANSKSESKAIWICLDCGHLSCGGVGLPTTPQSHALRHAKQNHHPLAVHKENPQLLWCFHCSKLIPVEKSLDSCENKGVLPELVKMLKGRSSEGLAVDVEDVWFGSSSETGVIKLDYSLRTVAEVKNGYLVRGLVNLGNTCFFNSVMQNLLASNTLRNYFCQLEESVGPLSASLKKLFLETSADTGMRSVINPRSLFGVVCTKAPQFRGYQQHDSHELLRCLLDSLSNEELAARKHLKSCLADKTSLSDSMFMDIIFGGELSSTVRCLECGHSSTIYEPFLDLSLPVPTKKPPPKKVQPAARGKKPKLPPKRNAKLRPKIIRDASTLSAESVLEQSTDSNTFGEVQSRVQSAENLVLPTDDFVLSDSVDPNAIALDMGFTPEDLSANQKLPDLQPVDGAVEQSASADSFAWLDYLDPHPVLDDVNGASENDEISRNMVSTYEDVNNNVSFITSLASSGASDSGHETSVTSSFSTKPLDSPQPGFLTQQESVVSRFENERNPTLLIDGQLSPEGSLDKEVEGYNTNLSHSSASCNQICMTDSKLSVLVLDRDVEPPPVQNSEIILFPYKEDAISTEVELSREIGISSEAIGDERENMDFDGFSDLFNEPEPTLVPRPSERDVSEENSSGKIGGVVGNNSDSDPDEVDNSDAAVSVESCLAFFTKPETLFKEEHAWQCDSCSNILRENKVKSQRNMQTPGTEILPNGCLEQNPSGLEDVGRNCDEGNSINWNVEEDRVDALNGQLLPDNGEDDNHGNCLLESNSEVEMNMMACQSVHQELNKFRDLCSSSYANLDTCTHEGDSNKVGFAENDILAAKCESGKGDSEEANSVDVKVKRDATKSILINKTPTILTIHLKRFSQDARGRLSKLNGHVNFRETLDLRPYMDPRTIDKSKHTYHLLGVVEHLGTMRGGHYVAYVRGTKSNGDCVWYHASDAYVREASLEEVLRSEAYILFYEGTQG